MVEERGGGARDPEGATSTIVVLYKSLMVGRDYSLQLQDRKVMGGGFLLTDREVVWISISLLEWEEGTDAASTIAAAATGSGFASTSESDVSVTSIDSSGTWNLEGGGEEGGHQTGKVSSK